MDAADDKVRLRLDLAAGLIEIDAPAGHFESVVGHAKSLLALAPARAEPPRPAERMGAAQLGSGPSQESANDSEVSAAAERKPRIVRTSGGSSGRPGRIGSFEPVQFGFSEEQERSILDLFTHKKPQEQGEQIAVALYAAERAGKRLLEYNEIYSIMRLGGIKPLPKAIDVVLTRLIGENWVAREGKAFALKFVGREYIEERLPAAA